MTKITPDKNIENYTDFINYLFTFQNLKYKQFSHKLIPNTKYEIIGINLPTTKNIAKSLLKENKINLLNNVQHKYHEEILIKGFLISKQPIETIFESINNYLPYIDNWATCDSFSASLKIVNKHKDKFYNYIKELLESNITYNIRFALVLLIDYYIEEQYLIDIFTICNNIKNEDYYVKMAIAWLISAIFVKYPDNTYPYLKNNKLDKFTHNKAIQKIIESNKINKETKENLKNYKIK